MIRVIISLLCVIPVVWVDASTSSQITPLAGSGAATSIDGIGTNAAFNTLTAIAVQPSFVIVTDVPRVRQVSLLTGAVTTLAGSTIGYRDGEGVQAQFTRPNAVVISNTRQKVYIADWNSNPANHRIRVLDLPTNVVSTLALSGPSLLSPSGLCLSGDEGTLYVADTWQVLRITINGLNGDVDWVTGSGLSIGYRDGFGDEAFFANLVALSATKDGNYLLLADSSLPGAGSSLYASNAIRRVDLVTREVITIAGGIQPGYQDGAGTNVLFDQPSSISVSSDGIFALIADYGNQRVRSLNITSNEVITLAGIGPGLPLKPSSRKSKGDAIGITPDGLIIMLTNVSRNGVDILKCPEEDCGPNFYRSVCSIISPSIGDGKCIACPPNAVSLRGSKSLTDCSCDFGYYAGYNNCTACPAGTYKDDWVPGYQDASKCKACNKTGYSSFPGTKSKLNCTVCAVGYRLQAATCLACPNNTYKNVIGNSSCLKCPNGSTSFPASSFCNCQENMTLDVLTMSCVCVAGFTGPIGGPCTRCASGKYKSVDASPMACESCPSDSFSNSGASLCTCNAGFSSEISNGVLYCATCTNGTYKNFSGNEQCPACDTPQVCSVYVSTTQHQTTAVTNASLDYVTTSAEFFNDTTILNDTTTIDGDANFTSIDTESSTPALEIGVNDSALETSAESDILNSSATDLGTTSLSLQALSPSQPSRALLSEITDSNALASDLSDTATSGDTISTGESSESVRKNSADSAELIAARARPRTTKAPATTKSNKKTTTISIHTTTAKITTTARITSTSAARNVSNNGTIETFANFSNITNQTQDPVGTPGGAFWFICTRLVNSRCLRCPHEQLDSIPGIYGVASCSCKPAFYGINLSSALEPFNSISTSPNLTEVLLLSSLRKQQSLLAGRTLCYPCPNGTYKIEIGPGPCTRCPNNSVSLGQSANISSCICNAGYSKVVRGLNSLSCVPCSIGSYKEDPRDDYCTVCPEPKTTFFTGSTNGSSQCVCKAGYYVKSPGQSNICNKCERGKFKNSTGNQPCTPCEQGYYQDQLGSTTCKACPVGTYNEKYGQRKQCASCLPCPDHTTTLSNASKNKKSCVCARGYYGFFEGGNGTCNPCGAGKYKPYDGSAYEEGCLYCMDVDEHSDSLPGSFTCQCDQGYTRPNPAQETQMGGLCTACERGKYKDVVGDSACEPCGANQVSADPPDHCEWCPDYSTLSPGGGTISDCLCDAGFKYSTYGYGTFDCIKCEPGTVKSRRGNEAYCQDCYWGQYSDPEGINCENCPEGSSSEYRSVDVTACSCNAGYTGDITSKNSTCTLCDDGTYKTATGPSACIVVPPDAASEPDRSDFRCNDGFAKNEDRTGCQPCTTFYTQNATKNQTFCDKTSYFEQQLCSCTPCSPNSQVYFEAQAEWFNYNEFVNATTFFQFATVIGATDLSACLCNSGYTCPFYEAYPCWTDCQQCQSGTYKDGIGNAACFECPRAENDANLTSPAGSISELNCTCEAGYIIVEPQPNIKCLACERGKYSPQMGATECLACAVQKTSDIGSYECRECRGDDICVCDKGNTDNGVGVGCSKCAKGTYKDFEGPEPCDLCKPPLTFQDQVGQTACKSCTPTKRCPDGLYWETCHDDRDGACLPCKNEKPANSRYIGPGQPLNTSFCPWTCNNGYELTSNPSTPCRACAPGKYKNRASGKGCSDCPLGSTTLTHGQSYCAVCIDGFYFSGFENVGHAICFKCGSRGTTTNHSADNKSAIFSDACRCDVGHYGCPWNCTHCPKGKYKDLVTSKGDSCYRDSCSPCPEGTYNGLTGQSSLSACQSCPDATVSNADRSSCFGTNCTLNGGENGTCTSSLNFTLADGSQSDVAMLL